MTRERHVISGLQHIRNQGEHNFSGCGFLRKQIVVGMSAGVHSFFVGNYAERQTVGIGSPHYDNAMVKTW